MIGPALFSHDAGRKFVVAMTMNRRQRAAAMDGGAREREGERESAIEHPHAEQGRHA
jgi:hypothetical protein